MKRLLVLVVFLLALAPVAEASPRQTVEISVTPAGFDAPRTLRSGAVTFHVRSIDPDGAWLGMVRLRPGVSLERYLGDLERAMGNDPVEGGKAVLRDAEMLGGAAVAGVPAAVTLRVGPGEHYLVDFRDVGKPDLATRVRPVRVLPGSSGSVPAVSAQITMLDGKFVAPRTLAGPVRVVNSSSQHNEAMLMPVRPGTSLADLDAFFTEVDAGRYPHDSPFIGGPTGVVPMSPWRSAALSTALPSGEYALVTWVRELRTGKMFAARGMRALVTVKG
ncbi:hypothetical protein [Kibdelosporangium phytohabitans]|uniref:Uncharacterized protein n=1 Tax=Kibdelosporangium phytohabitans TaxID=860235 RepID=A0A0N9HVL3_9PSEU|nr:hypothetical protein [Kibdelosporangium phytohabitans]ALG06133.1 hypothetical protein AOZ06_03640 [Kibdelosporangium phytohabitans]MBE1465776.1 hypothetical protein [Kibdelosporangium phytohabitans]